MKKKILSLALSLLLILTVFPAAAFASERFTDVTDAALLQNIDILGLMGIVSDNSEKLFYPDDTLTRAEFCKMAVIAMGNGNLEPQYKNTCIFPDVRASHWASGYVAVAAKGPGKFIGGYPDGTFGPELDITYGEAITVIMRLLGYTDSDSGAVWPDGYVNLGKKSGVCLSGVSASTAITRRQAAELFVSLIAADTPSGTAYASKLGTVASKTTLKSISGNTAKFEDGTEYKLQHTVVVASLAGRTGYPVVGSDGKLVTFIPEAVTPSSAPSSAAVIVAQNGSTAGFEAITGGVTDYTIYRNGTRISSSSIQKDDVATYDPKTNTVQLCDTKLSAYYEDCTPSPSDPATITVLGGLKLEVLTSAKDSFSGLKPGNTVVLSLTADGKVAAASRNASGANARAIVGATGAISLICGGNLISLPSSVTADSKYFGQCVSISSYKKDELSLSILTAEASTGLKVSEKTLAGTKIADGALIFSDGESIQLSDLKSDVAAKNVLYYEKDVNGQICLAVLSDTAEGVVYFGVSALSEGMVSRPTYVMGGEQYYEDVEVPMLVLSCGKILVSPEKECEGGLEEGVYMAATLKNDKYRNAKVLTKIGTVSKSSFIGETVVNCGGTSYTIPSNAAFYNTDTKNWTDSRDTAFAYADHFTLYGADGIVYIIEYNAD